MCRPSLETHRPASRVSLPGGGARGKRSARWAGGFDEVDERTLSHSLCGQRLPFCRLRDRILRRRRFKISRVWDDTHALNTQHRHSYPHSRLHASHSHTPFLSHSVTFPRAEDHAGVDERWENSFYDAKSHMKNTGSIKKQSSPGQGEDTH